MEKISERNKYFDFEDSANLLGTPGYGLIAMGTYDPDFYGTEPYIIQSSSTEFNTGSNSIKIVPGYGAYPVNPTTTKTYWSNVYYTAFAEYNLFDRANHRAWAYEEFDVSFDIKIEHNTLFDGSLSFLKALDLNSNSFDEILDRYPNHAVVNSLRFIYTKIGSYDQIQLVCTFFIKNSGNIKEINPKFLLCNANSGSINLDTKINIQIKKDINGDMSILINSIEILKFINIFTGPITTNNSNPEFTFVPSIYNQIKTAPDTESQELIKPFLAETIYQNCLDNSTKDSLNKDDKFWNRTGDGATSIFTSTDGTVTLNGQAEYEDYFNTAKAKYYPNVYIDNLSFHQALYKYSYDLINPISLTVLSDKTSFSSDILDPITVDIGEDVIEDLFTITVPVKDDFSVSLLDPINIEVQLDKSETDLFNITLDVDAPVYQLELGPEFVSGWDDRKYLVFRNGHLLPKQTYNIIIPSHHNNYLKKILYSTVGFSKGDRIEVFYIENQENFANVPFNRDVHLASYIYYAKSNKEKLIKIPYPNSSYRRSKDAFYLFNDKGEHLDCRYDYTVSADGRYITLSEKNILETMLVNYLVFTFCYVENRSINGQEQDRDMFDTINISEIKYKYSYSIEKLNDISGLVEFTPTFTDYPNILKENFMLFGNSVFIDPERYEVVDNNHIQFTNPSDIPIANSRRYTMCIPVKETKPAMKNSNQVIYQVVDEIATINNQSIFTLSLPQGAKEWYPFLLFRGSRLMDVYNEYEYDESTNIVTITDPSCFVQLGRALTIVYINKNNTDIKDEIKYIKMQFDVDVSGITKIPEYLYKNPLIQFDPSNLLLFMNGVFLEPERYTIDSGNIINMNINPTISGYNTPYMDKTYTGIYLIQYPSSDSWEEFNDEYGQKEIDPSEDNDETRFDEMYAVVKRKS